MVRCIEGEGLSVTRFRGHRLSRIVVGGRVFGEACACAIR